MENKFKEYYDDICKNISEDIDTKHRNHSNFYNEVNRIREDIKSGDQSWKQDKDFLEKLLYRQDNGIVNIASYDAEFSCDKFLNLIIIDDSFMSALEEFIVTPAQVTHTKFDAVWGEKQKLMPGLKYNDTLINRVAPACTLEVSIVAHPGMFDYLFNWLVGEKIIPKYPSNADQGWFSKNQFLMKEIKQQFHKELASGETNEIYLSDFAIYLYDYIR